MPHIDASKIENAQARNVLAQFLMHREINREFYRRVPADKLDYRMADTKSRRSDSPRESLVHQLYVTRNYVHSVRTGVMQWGEERVALLVIPAWQTWDKQRLLSEMQRIEQELATLLSEPDIESRQVAVPWSREPLPALTLLRGLIDHEILHTGWNLALMDLLDIERFPALKDHWG